MLPLSGNQRDALGQVPMSTWDFGLGLVVQFMGEKHLAPSPRAAAGPFCVADGIQTTAKPTGLCFQPAPRHVQSLVG